MTSVTEELCFSGVSDVAGEIAGEIGVGIAGAMVGVSDSLGLGRTLIALLDSSNRFCCHHGSELSCWGKWASFSKNFSFVIKPSLS